MLGLEMEWAFLGIPGIRELLVVAVVALVLYGRSGLILPARHLRGLRPWLTVAQRASGASRPPSASAAPHAALDARSRRERRVFWVLTILAATAVAAWVVTRTIIAAHSGPSH